jgi:hypothetical protein
MFFILATIVIIFLFIIIYFKFYVQILNADELFNELKHDKDGYFKSMNSKNLQIRNVKSVDEYLDILNKSCYTISFYEKIILYYNIWKIKQKLHTIKCIGIDNTKLQNIKFKIGCFKGKEYEFGYPHTRCDIIILNYDNIYSKDLDKTLVHELIHIYQKKYPNDIQAYLNFYNFSKVSSFNNFNRLNPDITNDIYQHYDLLYQCNISKNNNIICTNNDSKFEHPYEYMAYMISDNI